MSFRKFLNFRNFCIYIHNIGNFFVIFGQIDNFYILVEFEVDKMCPNESTKNERKGAQGLY